MPADASPDPSEQSLDVDGNRLTLLPDGPQRLIELLALIDGATQSLRLLYYIYTDDESGAAVHRALGRALDRGLKVALLVDGFGCNTPDGYFTPLTAKGMLFCKFHPTFGRKYLIRNHQKLALADDHRVIIGGFNIEDSYFGTDADGAWRDLGLLVDGPAAGRLGPYYDELLAWATAKGGKIRALNRIIHRFSETQGKLQWTYGGPTRGMSPWALATCRDLLAARDVAMIAAYFAPTWAMLRRISLAGQRGKARIITASKSDNHATIAAARYTYKRLLRRGVEVYEYSPTKLHSKLVVLDNIVHIGSSNFDIRSLYLNLEMMLRVDDAAFAKMMRGYFEGEKANSERITPALHRQRSGFLTRIVRAISFFLVTSADYTLTRRLNFRRT
ncbi:phosphatidylserine/phosphatidylglycerophosphate/cardiolipin synthase family protein [Sphingomonas sp. LY160]|uniref:phospholipase D-like domain-containing protein n=1 Tax=Sphingomonas sp. LY160 TaxID=3095342 RepID=UPI002ADEDDC2|nr:phosphatidylserine/phosphatidylglycerophosphate/cardiolipin synthase family protein [Sphingomonas sp. LY160]MEA1072587.1 phosphatidylserine/phosphatidylglycerophosphate/cardiolipin synthase family protein [Sphingomonas sp. LY160]